MTVILINNTINVSIPEYNPNLPISLAIVSNFYCNGVISASCSINAYILPTHEYYPTTNINSLPSPESTVVPESIAGDGRVWLSLIFFEFSLRISSLASIH